MPEVAQETAAQETPLTDQLYKSVAGALALAETMVEQASGTPFESKVNGVYDALENANLRVTALRTRLRRNDRTTARKAAKAEKDAAKTAAETAAAKPGK